MRHCQSHDAHTRSPNARRRALPQVRRRPGFTLINVAFPSMVICGLPAVVFSIQEAHSLSF